MLKWLHPEIKFKNISRGKVNAETAGIREFEKLARNSISLFREREQKIISLEEMDDSVNVVLDYYAVLTSGDLINLIGKSEYFFKDGLISSIIDEG